MGKSNESKLKIVIEAQNKAAAELQKIVGELQKMGKATGDADKKQASFGQSLGAIKGQLLGTAAGVAAFGVAMKKAFDFAQEGASLLRLETATTSLATSMGGNMDDIVAAIKRAAAGTISETAIMGSAGRAMMLGLGSDSDKLANLMQVAMFRGRAMGLSAEQAFSDIVTGVGRLSPMILDNLGIVLDAEKTYTEYAKALGKSADELSSVEKRQALLNRVLEEGNRMIEEAGGVADDAATPYERLAANVTNVMNDVKTGMAETFAPAVGWLADNVDVVGQLHDKFGGLSGQVAKTKNTYLDYVAALYSAADAAGLIVDEQGNLIQRTVQSGHVTETVIEKNYLWSESLYAVMNGIEAIPDDSFVEKANRMALAADGAKYSMDELALFMQGAVGKETERFGNAVDKTGEDIAETEAALRKLGVDPYASPEQLAQLDTLNGKLLAANIQLRNMEKGSGVGSGAFSSQEGLGDKLREGGIDEQTIQQVSDINVEIGTLYRQITDLGGKPFLTPDQRSQIDELQGKLTGLKTQQTENTDEHKRNMNEMIYNMAQTQVAADGITTEEQEGLIALAENLGLVDESTAALWEQTATWVSELSGAQKEADELGVAIEEIPAFKQIIIEIKAMGDTGIIELLGDKTGPGVAKGKDVPQEGLASGGSFVVPGTGGIDSRYVGLNLTPGEHVEVTPAGKKVASGAGGGTVLKNYGTIIVQSLEEAGYGGRL